MSVPDVLHVLRMSPTWGDPLELSVLIEVARYYNPAFGYAWPALETIGKRVKRSPRRVNEAVVRLEVRGLVIRLGPDPQTLGSKQGTNRYVPIWRVEEGLQQQLREASEHDAGTGLTGAESRMGACGISHGGHAESRMPGMRNLACDLSIDLCSTEVDQGTRTATAAAQPRLPTLLATVRRTLVEEILRKRQAFLSADPATDGNFKAITKAATDVLADPALGARLVKGYDPTRPSDVREAVRRLCEKRHIDWGKPSYERIDGAVTWAEVKPRLLAGEARPRELAERRR